jgi:hypothetical protein
MGLRVVLVGKHGEEVGAFCPQENPGQVASKIATWAHGFWWIWGVHPPAFKEEAPGIQAALDFAFCNDEEHPAYFIIRSKKSGRTLSFTKSAPTDAVALLHECVRGILEEALPRTYEEGVVQGRREVEKEIEALLCSARSKKVASRAAAQKAAAAEEAADDEIHALENLLIKVGPK